ncbi:MAG: sulfatase-like hydrolase/transferase, partial [Verrucomicrobiota bacterium]
MTLCNPPLHSLPFQLSLLSSVLLLTSCEWDLPFLSPPSQTSGSPPTASVPPLTPTPAPPPAPVQKEGRNVILIVADDMGYTDLGCFGGEIRTPHLDAMAYNGIRFTNFHASPTCSPTRSMLMSGTDHHVAGVGNMLEQLTSAQEDQPGYEGYLNDKVAPLPALLRASQVQAYMAGKWHLGLTEERSPTARGFHRAFSLLVGSGSHFTRRSSDATYPKVPYREDGESLESLPDDFFSTTAYTDKMISFIDEGREESPQK